MKSYTDLEQSKKLAEILPLESADMWWNFYSVTTDNTTPQIIHIDTPWVGSFNWNNEPDNIPCWSLAALLEEIPSTIVNNVGEDLKLHIEKDELQYSLFYENEYTGDMFEIETELYDDIIDSCYEMIIKLHELNLL